MICPKCKAEISDKSKFCKFCGTKIEAPAGNGAEVHVEAAAVCGNCGSPLRPGAKFCTVCGNSVSATAAQSPRVEQVPRAEQSPRVEQVPRAEQSPRVEQVPRAEQSPRVEQSAPQPEAGNAAVQQNKPKKKSKLPALVVSIFLLLVVAVGGYFVMTRVLKIDLFAMAEKDDTDEDGSEGGGDEEPDGNGENDKKDGESDKESGIKPSAEPAEKHPELLDELDPRVTAVKQKYDEGAYEEVKQEGIDITRRYFTIAEENDLKNEAADKIRYSYYLASKATIAYCDGIIEGQEIGSAGYYQVKDSIEEVLQLGKSLTENGYAVETMDITEYNDSLIPRLKNIFIMKINSFTEREQWSRDEAWAYANQAYSIQVLFNEEDLDDPMRLRYVYCLAWKTSKECENGVANGTMSAMDAFDKTAKILKETDYNLLVLQDAITYGIAAGMDTSKYLAAYDAIVKHLKEEQGLSIVNFGVVNAGTGVDIRKFWYFNDLDDDTYMVDDDDNKNTPVINGTTQATRNWIRENIPNYIN